MYFFVYNYRSYKKREFEGKDRRGCSLLARFQTELLS